MKKDRPAYVYPKGPKGLLYFCRRGAKPIRMHEALGTPDFSVEYAKLLRGVAPVPEGRKIATLAASYKRSDRYEALKPRTKADYDKVLAFIVDRLGNLAADKMQRKDVIRLRDAYAGTVRFANYLVQVARILFEHAIDIGWIDQNPAKGVKMLKSKAEPRQPWPDDLVQAYRDTATGNALLIFELCLGTGQRIGDVLKMQWGHIADDGIEVSQGKTGSKLWIPITPRLRAVLDGAERSGLFIVAKDGRPVSYRAAAHAVMEARKRVGAEAYNIHDLRHTTASELASLGMSDELIKSITGHTSTASVARYAGAARQRARAKQAQDQRE